MSKDLDKNTEERRIDVRRSKNPPPYTGPERRKEERRESWEDLDDSAAKK